MEAKKYVDMTYKELGALDRKRTVFFSSISPLETHGPHLPMGTDIFIAEALRDRIIESLKEKHPDLTVVLLPTLAIGSDAIPVGGSVRVRYQAILYVLLDTGRALAKMGFKYWVLTDNHGGPHHQIAIELAARKLAKDNFHLIAPFHEVFRRMVERAPDLEAETGLTMGSCGDVEDSHAGRNETSLMLAAHPEKVREGWEKVGKGKTPPRKLPFRLLTGASRLLSAAGARDAAVDFHFLAHGLAWVSDPEMETYQGVPGEASAEAGEAMLRYRAKVAVELLEKAMAGKRVRLKPLGWSIRSLRNVI
ncbi:MAG: creatininase family protein [bacterium]